jgi:phosphoglycolate phosphatase
MPTSKNLNIISGVIFDLDGTLLNTLEDIACSMNTVLKRHKFPTHSIDTYRTFIGQGLAHLAKRAIQYHHNNGMSVDTIINELYIEYEKTLTRKTNYYKGISELLDELTSLNIPMAILSNKHDFLTKMLAQHYFQKWPFKIISGAKPDFPKKPDPFLALEILKNFGIKSEECIFIGDTQTDIETAIGAGMFPIGVLWGFRDRDTLLEAGAKLIVEKPSEILDFISNNTITA